MIILTLRTDKPESEIGLFDNDNQLAYIKWEAHRQLAETIHQKIQQMLNSQKTGWEDIEGVVFYQGPGSFTGLRIGASTANAIAGSLEIPVVATSGKDWLEFGIKALETGKNHKIVLPEYGTLPNITKPRQ